jgi:predicted RNA-binding Zn-ribbon protein involved in translation (DUF1610 family)
MIIYECPECGGAILREVVVGGLIERKVFFSNPWPLGPKIKVGPNKTIELPKKRWECTECGHIVPADTYDELWQWVMDHQLPNGEEE